MLFDFAEDLLIHFLVLRIVDVDDLNQGWRLLAPSQTFQTLQRLSDFIAKVDRNSLVWICV